MSQTTDDSLKKRYLYKLSTNLVGLGIALVTQALIPRGLGPKAYGDFHFLTGFFGSVQNFLDMGTSTCFFTKLSQRPDDSRLVSFYLYVVGLSTLLILLFVVGADFVSMSSRLWPDQEMIYVYFAAIFAILAWVSGIAARMGDAYGVTVATEKARIIQKIFGFAVLVYLYFINQLHLAQFFFYNYLILLFLMGALVWIISKKGFYSKHHRSLSGGQAKAYGKEFYHYSHPLFIAALAGNAATILDRWWLQTFAGSEQQGFFGFSFLIGTAYMLFANAMEPLLMREFAIAYVKKDYEQIAAIFRQYVPSFYSLAAFFSCFVAVQSEKVIHIMGGSKYLDAGPVVMIMAFFPIHQSYGQLSGSLLFATNQTVLMRNISIAVSLIGIPITYFLVAPVGKMGLNAGAAGLAIKMVAMQFIGVNIQLYFNTKMLKLNFWRYVVHQVLIVSCLLLLAAAASRIVDSLFRERGMVIASFILSGILYTALTLGLAFLFPRIFGLKSADLKSIVDKMRQKGKERP
jgi:O-antigen/teichoic acid export membrane protein